MKAEIPIKILKLEDGFHLVSQLCVNGRVARMLIDTGASTTVFDRQRTARFLPDMKLEKHDKLSTGLGTNNMQSQLAVIDRIVAGKIEIRNYKAVVMDLSHVNVAYGEMKQKPIDGVLGSDIFKKYNAVIDYGKKKLLLSTSCRA